MRIIAGQWKGRKLVSFKASHIRPTTDRVKEALFNKIQFDIEGASVLDLFSGTGNLSFEALSRGAAQSVAVESHPQSLSILRKNEKLFQPGSSLKVIPSDVLRFIKKSPLDSFDLILIDPPFTKAMSDEVLEAFGTSSALAPHVRIFIESSSKENVKDRYSKLECVKCLSFGDKQLREFRTIEKGC